MANDQKWDFNNTGMDQSAVNNSFSHQSLNHETQFVPFSGGQIQQPTFDFQISQPNDLGSTQKLNTEPSQSSLGAQVVPPQQQQQQISQNDNQIVQQYEQVLAIMHGEMQKLIQQNQDLCKQVNEGKNQVQLERNSQFQYLQKENEDLVETLRQREIALLTLRQENEQLNNQVIDLQSQLSSFNPNGTQKMISDHQLQFQNSQLSERVKKIENLLRISEQQVFELESMNKNLKRDLKHQTIVNDQLQQEIQDINIKRDTLDKAVQDCKNKLCQAYLQQRQMNNMIENQQIEITNLTNAKTQSKKEEELVHFQNNQLKDQLTELETQKLQIFQQSQVKDKELQNIKAVLRRFVTVIQTHRECFGDVADINYEGLFRDISNVNLNFQLPQSNYAHLLKPKQTTQSQPQQFNSKVESPVKHKKVTNENTYEDYYGMVDRLTQYVRDQNPGLGIAKQSSGDSNLPNLPSFMRQSQQDSKIVWTSQKSNTEQVAWTSQKQGNNTTEKVAWTSQKSNNTNEQNPPATVNWLSEAKRSSVQEEPVPAVKNRIQGKTPEKKPNVEGLKTTLSSLLEEKRQLEQQMKGGHSHKTKDDIAFDLEVIQKNIKTVQDKISAATK